VWQVSNLLLLVKRMRLKPRRLAAERSVVMLACTANECHHQRVWHVIGRGLLPDLRADLMHASSGVPKGFIL